MSSLKDKIKILEEKIIHKQAEDKKHHDPDHNPLQNSLTQSPLHQEPNEEIIKYRKLLIAADKSLEKALEYIEKIEEHG